MRVLTDPGLAWVLVLVAICLASAQGLDKPKKPAEPAWEPTVEGFRMSLRSTKAEYVEGEKLNVQVVLQNADAKDRDVVVAAVLRYYLFSVTRANGMAVPMTSRGKQLVRASSMGSRSVRTLRPREEVTAGLDLGEVFDLKMSGEYRIGVSHDVWNRDDDKKVSKVTSNTLVIKVTEKGDKKHK